MVILLNGSINSGKSTIGRYIASLGIGFAHIEVDHLRNFIDWMPLQASIELNLKNAASVASNFHDNTIDSVITYPLSSKDYEFIGRLLEGQGIEYSAVTLFPGLETLRANRGHRELTPWELSRIDQLYSEGTSTPGFGITIDNSEISIEETAMKVLRAVGINRSSHRTRKGAVTVE